MPTSSSAPPPSSGLKRRLCGLKPARKPKSACTIRTSPMAPSLTNSRTFPMTGVKRVHMASIKNSFLCAGGLDDFFGLGGIDGEGFFAQDGLAAVEAEQGVFPVQRVGRGDVDGVHIRVGGQRLIRAVAARCPELRAEGVRLLL